MLALLLLCITAIAVVFASKGTAAIKHVRARCTYSTQSSMASKTGI
jgi:hypothetical protein